MSTNKMYLWRNKETITEVLLMSTHMFLWRNKENIAEALLMSTHHVFI